MTSLNDTYTITIKCSYNDDCNDIMESTTISKANDSDFYDFNLIEPVFKIMNRFARDSNLMHYPENEILTKEESDILLDFELYKYYVRASEEDEMYNNIEKIKNKYRDVKLDFRDDCNNSDIDLSIKEFFPVEEDNGYFYKFLNGCYMITSISVIHVDSEGKARKVI